MEQRLGVGHDDHGWWKTRPAWLRYLAAPGIVVASVALPMVFTPTLGIRFPLITLFPVVMVEGLGAHFPVPFNLDPLKKWLERMACRVGQQVNL